MAARPHGADEPREGPIDEPIDEGGPERAPGRSAHREEPQATGSSGPAEDGERSADGMGTDSDQGTASTDEHTEERGAAPDDDDAAHESPSVGQGSLDGASVGQGSLHPEPLEPASVDPAVTDVAGAGAAGAAADAAPRGAPGAVGRAHDEADDVDARWKEIIAELADLDSGATASGAADPDTGQEAGPEAGAVRAPVPDPTAARTVRPAAPASSYRSWSPDPAVEEAEDHFEPPDPGPVLGGDPLLTMAWAVVVGVPVLFIAAVVLWRDIPTVVLRSAAVAFLAGVGLLLWRMPHRRDEDDGPGAVV